MAGLTAFLGHLFPVWLGFKGGKGVATFLGTLLALAFPVGLAACATWLVTAVISRISSLSALVSAALAAIWAGFLGHGDMVILIVTLATLVFWRHLPNIERLRAGTEPKIGGKK
jgi:glycerol-3-phosphate acyltransferase PlsY